MKIIQVHPDDSRAALAETSQLQQAGATKLSTRRTFGVNHP